MKLGIPGARGSPIGLVMHVGRRSGRTLATPLAVHRVGLRCLIPLTYGPGARWCQNVLAAGCCRLRLRGLELTLVRPRVVGSAALPMPFRLLYRLVGIREFLQLSVDLAGARGQSRCQDAGDTDASTGSSDKRGSGRRMRPRASLRSASSENTTPS